MVVLSFVIYIFLTLYLEIIFKIFVFKSFSFVSFFQLTLFLLFISLILSFLTNLFSKKVNKIILYTAASIISLFYCAQFCINDMFKTFISTHLFGAAGQVMDFIGEGASLVIDNILVILMLLAPLIVLIIFNKKIVIRKSKKKLNIIYGCLILSSFLIFNASLLINKDETYSSYNLVYNLNDVNLTAKKLGVGASFYLEAFKNITNFEEKIVINSSSIPGYTEPDDEYDEFDEVIVYDYNNLDIDFNFSGSSSVETLNSYFSGDTGTLQNEYTSLFEGKNLIYIMAETFNEIAVDEERTPTLYKLVNEGFYFENFYTPTIYSTIGGEFQLLTGLYPASGFLNTFKSGTNSFPFGLSTVFENLGYTSYAFHNNTYTFQNRNLYLPSLGFNNFLACGNGLESLIDCDWLQSDSEMFETTFDYYSSDENFVVFYATVSGHGDYYYSHEFASKYSSLVDDSLSEKIASYLAAQIELDRALEILLENLNSKGILEDTVIVLSGDHHPYYLDIDEINEASSYVKDEVIEVDHSNLIIYNAGTESTTISKVVSQTDILPTVYNLFGINYDSRLIIGKDALSSYPGLAIFGDRSWVSDYGYYFASEDEFVLKSGLSVSDTYVDEMNEYVQTKINVSSLIMSTNYYQYVEKYFS